MTQDDPEVVTIILILTAVEEIAKALADTDPKLALDRATHWAKVIGTDRAYLLAMGQRQARDGKEKAQAIIVSEAETDLQQIAKLMGKWGWEQIECSGEVAVVTKPAPGKGEEA